MSNKKISDLPAAGTITGAELVELSQGGVSVQSTTGGIKNGGVKVYRALISQVGNGAPTAIVLENTIGGVFTYAYVSSGNYTLTNVNAFTVGKTFYSIAQSSSTDADPPDFFSMMQTNASTLTISTYSLQLAIPEDEMLGNTPIEIMVYP